MTAPAGPVSVTARAREALDKFIRELPRLETSPEGLANAVIGAARWFAAFTDTDQTRILAAVSRITGRHTEWCRRLFSLSELEIRRAIRSRPPRLDRHGHEALYPADGWLGAYLLYAQDSEAPLGWQFWCAVAILGMTARRNFYWDRGRYVLYLNHYLLVIGETGLKKTTSIDQTVEILRLACEKSCADTTDPVPFYFSPDRVTPEALDADLSAWHKAQPDSPDTICALLNDEVATLLGKNVWGADRIIHFLTAVYGGKQSYRDASVGRGKREMKNLQMTCLFGSAPDWIRDSVTDEMLTGGFLGRCIMVPRHEPHGVFSEPLPSDPVVKHVLAEQLVPWVRIDGPVECRRTPEVTSWFDDWYHTHKEKKPADPRLLGWWNRKDDHLHKLAAILRLSELVGSGPGAYAEIERTRVLTVGMESFEQALKLLDDEEERLPKLIAMVGASLQARTNERIAAILDEQYRAKRLPVPHSMLLRKCGHFVGNAWEFDRAIATLDQQDVLVVVNQGVGPKKTGRTYLPAWASVQPMAPDEPAIDDIPDEPPPEAA